MLKRNRVKTISNLVALLIIISIVIAIGLVVSGTLVSFLQRSTPKKGVLTLSGSEAVYDTLSGTLWITIRGQYVGSEKIKINKVVVVDVSSSGSGGEQTCYIYACDNVVYTENGWTCPIISSCKTGRPIDYPPFCVYICTQTISNPTCTLLSTFECGSPGSSTVIPVTPIASLSDVEPNSYIKIVLKGSVSNLDPRSKIIVAVSYCFADNTCFSASEVINVRFR